MIKLNFGCGWECLDGWTNVDNTEKWQREQYPLSFMDVTQPWCYEDDSIDYIYSAHCIEHIPEKKNLFALKEAYRALKPGGVIRTVVPSREFYESLGTNDGDPWVERYCRQIWNRMPNLGDARKIAQRGLYEQGHVWVPNGKMLVDQHLAAGFVDVKLVEYGVSEHEELNGIDQVDGLREYESIVCEATKV